MPLDGSPLAEQALPHAEVLAERFRWLRSSCPLSDPARAGQRGQRVPRL